jgi:hypothetical protein
MRPAQEVRLTASLVVLLGLLGRLVSAGDYHSAATSTCSDCHTMHNSQDGQPMRYDSNAAPAAELLRAANGLELCIHCHNASATAPDVIADDANNTPDRAGGLFPQNWSTASGSAHVLGASPLIPPGGTQAMSLTCTSCHDPHGSASYRNLKLDPLGAGVSLPVTSHQIVARNGSNIPQVYTSANIRYKSGISNWCASCHGPQDPGIGHVVDKPISGAPSTDSTYWLNTDFAALAPAQVRVPVQTPTDDTLPSADDQVFCLSCHKAHGSANPRATLFADGLTLDSTCNQCHNK